MVSAVTMYLHPVSFYRFALPKRHRGMAQDNKQSQVIYGVDSFYKMNL